MKETVDFERFSRAFSQSRNKKFSETGKEILFEYLTRYEESTGIELELDVIAFCTAYAESSWQELAEERGLEKTEEAVRKNLLRNGEYIGHSGDQYVYAYV